MRWQVTTVVIIFTSLLIPVAGDSIIFHIIIVVTCKTRLFVCVRTNCIIMLFNVRNETQGRSTRTPARSRTRIVLSNIVKKKIQNTDIIVIKNNIYIGLQYYSYGRRYESFFFFVRRSRLQKWWLPFDVSRDVDNVVYAIFYDNIMRTRLYHDTLYVTRDTHFVSYKTVLTNGLVWTAKTKEKRSPVLWNYGSNEPLLISASIAFENTMPSERALQQSRYIFREFQSSVLSTKIFVITFNEPVSCLFRYSVNVSAARSDHHFGCYGQRSLNRRVKKKTPWLMFLLFSLRLVSCQLF